jgi:Flp pilus assembly pilin Flp
MSVIRRLLSGDREQGSQTTEYALLIVVSATIASLALAWARKGAVTGLFDLVMKQVHSLLGIG